jgi:ATP-dependent exoDNAse (exonuclease V) alpha subunit
LVWVDEAGLIGTKTMGELFSLADKLDCRILLRGDARQHGSVSRGDTLRMLEREAGVVPAEVKEIKRQAGEYKEAVELLSEGRTAEGFDRLDRLGWIRELPFDERYQRMADEYVAAVSAGKTCLVIAPTHREGELIDARIRATLKEKGKLGKQDRSFRVLQNANLTEAERGDALNYRPGDVLQFHQNAKGYPAGSRVEAGAEPLPLEHAARFTVFHPRELRLAKGDWIKISNNGYTADRKHRLNNGSLYRIRRFDRNGDVVLENHWKISSDFGHIDYGYALTSHSSQGRTVDRVLVGQSAMSYAASSREQFYVSCSRGRESVTVYCDDKQALKEAVAQSDERVTATELIRHARAREVVHLHRRQAETERGREPQRERELIHER